MSIEAGKKFGPYEVIEKAGAGGMGEVFKAKDTRLDRIVAIKVLPTSVAGNPDLKQRFEREAKTISSLNHPNICTLYDIGVEDGQDYLVMEFLEGDTLSDRLKNGPIPMAELLQIASQIADALDKAHGQGLIHRDLKPANVMLTSTGAKLLDFGLAKLQVQNGVVDGASGITQTTPLTGTGTIIGTLQYMAPEQLEGKEADIRSDIFAFGALLYEMATGKKAFEGKSQASMIAGILEREPIPLSSLNNETPPTFERLVSKCLQKDPESRWQSSRDLADELRWVTTAGSQAGMSAVVSSRRKMKFRMAWIITTVVSLVAIYFAGLWFMRPLPTKNVHRFIVKTETTLSQVSWPRISPDGQHIAFMAADEDGTEMIWIRPMNSLDAYPLAGTENANRPFWSPDSKQIAFIVNRNQLKKISAAGGPAQIVCETNQGADGTWGNGGVIIYDAGTGDSLFQVPASGGTPTALHGLDSANEITNSWPWFLPDGKHFLYLSEMKDAAKAGGNYILKVGSVESDEVVELFPVDARVEYCMLGYLVYFRDGILLAQKFNPDNLEVIGEAVPLTDEIGVGEADRAEFGVSDEGTLTFQTNASISLNKLIWFDRKGDEISQVGEMGAFEDIALSPDETKLAISIWDGEDNEDIWVRDLKRDVATRITFGDEEDISPHWSGDGNYIYYSNNKDGLFGLKKKSANGLGQVENVYQGDSLHHAPTSISSDGRWLYGAAVKADWNLMRIDLQNPTNIEMLVATPYNERMGRISPNSKYFLYHSNESGNFETYVLELKEGGGRWQISANGGMYPAWSKDGKELYYFDPTWNFTAVQVTTEGSFSIGTSEKLFNTRLSLEGRGFTRYATSKDKNKFLMVVPMARTGGGEFVVVLNWHQEINQD